MSEIPKIIHYVWVGPKELSAQAKICIASWKKYLPDYTCMFWNEENSPMEHRYVQEMYGKKKWAFVSDYIRFWALYKHGGIYLDTDMEVLQSLNPLLKNDVFFAKTDDGYTACGIIGATPEQPALRAILDFYDANTEYSIRNTSPAVVTKTLQENTFPEVMVYDKERFYPCGAGESCPKELLKDAYTHNHWAESWVRFRLLRKITRHIAKMCGLYPLLQKINKYLKV